MPAKIIIIHGLNNNIECFFPLRDKLNSLGFETELLCLPGHGKDRDETKNVVTALDHFDNNMKELIHGPYMVIAFSQGALYLQLWLERNYLPQPLAQVLLAPALFIRHFSKLERLISILPNYLFLFSQTPKQLRRYHYLHIWEYRTLFNKAKKFQTIKTAMKVPTLILVDPKDELVDAQKLKLELDLRKSGARIEFIERKYLKGRRPGKHHVLFHPDYFEGEDWENLVKRIASFIKR